MFIVIIIDSVDTVLNGNSFDWLPVKMQTGSKVILTITALENDETISNLEKFFEYGIPNQNIIKFKYRCKGELNDALCSGGTSLYGDYRFSKILKGNTVFNAKVLCWLAWFGCFTIESSNISKVFENAFLTLETTFSSKDIAFMLLTLSVTNLGMRESDCIGIFRNYLQVDTSKSFRIWSKFCWILGPMLLKLNNIRIIDNNFRDAILRRYQYKQQFVHDSIRNYYERQPNTFTSSNGSSTSYNIQKLLKLPYHYLCALEETSNVRKSEQFFNSYFFTDLHWTNNKVIATGSIPLLCDIITAKRVLANRGDSYLHIDVLEKFLEKYFNELNYDGHQFLTLFKYFLRGKIDDALYKFNEVIMAWCSFIEQVKSTYLEIMTSHFQYENCKSFSGYDMLVYLPHKDFHVATLSTEREEICIWDIKKCERVREFKGIPQPTAIYPVGTVDAAVLCKREIKVISLLDGNFKVTLKGVMNQKMPYFGQHDEKHLVCLSRNRMYVNLMNLESGDCVTTFKAGEDRFLNSLLVSGDGRILVCGDETQKPFPLLVWHLSQRKLLYDLRIPHHDFMTSLSAITYEGAYVCVVAKEINEPAPNFIVVYDLQSGTMFKKWKPGCNTVSLAISQSNAAVVSGLENAKILIWDLVTGNCRSTLIGHNAPVSILKLDPFGNVLLSRDKESRDSSLRLWDVSSGKLLAIPYIRNTS